jgi:hypothetical protein
VGSGRSRLGRGRSLLGSGFPQVGRALPRLGRGVPPPGEHSPHDGEHSPSEGEHSPPGGEPSPREGEHSPSKGERSPRSFGGCPRVGERSPSEGKARPLSGSARHREGKARPPEGVARQIQVKARPASGGSSQGSGMLAHGREGRFVLASTPARKRKPLPRPASVLLGGRGPVVRIFREQMMIPKRFGSFSPGLRWEAEGSAKPRLRRIVLAGAGRILVCARNACCQVLIEALNRGADVAGPMGRESGAQG